MDLIEKSIQGPCGNSTYECLSKLDESQLMFIPYLNDEQLILGQVYSTINGCFGTVRIIILLKIHFKFF
jgi:hypothetical protein